VEREGGRRERKEGGGRRREGGREELIFSTLGRIAMDFIILLI
jgi:hypothetical protein